MLTSQPTTAMNSELFAGFRVALLTLLLLPASLPAKEPPAAAAEVLFREVRYEGKLSDQEARFTAQITGEMSGKGEAGAVLFAGDVAVPAAKLPPHLRLARDGNQYRLVADRRGPFHITLEVVAKVTQAGSWSQMAFTGPAAGIATVSATAGEGVDIQLLSGAPVADAMAGTTEATRFVRGVLGADRLVSLRWQGRQAVVARQALATCDTTAAVQITPTVVKFQTQFQFDVLQGRLARLAMVIPTNQTLTKVEGEQAKDWQVKTEAGRQVLSIEFLKPVENHYALTVATEQTEDRLPFAGALDLPQPLNMERENGAVVVTAEDTVVETGALTGLRQENAPAGALAAYRFYGRPLALPVQVRRVEPAISVASRVNARLEEARLVVAQTLNLSVEKAGIYQLELAPLNGMTVTDVRGEGVEDWKAGGASVAGRVVRPEKLTVTFNHRVLGARRLDVQLEQAEPTIPASVVVTPLRVAGAVKETAQIAAAAAPGIRLKTAELNGVRAVPVASLPERRGDEALAFIAEQAGWSVTLAAEQLRARVVAEIFNLVTLGDGLVGGSATIRYALFNQGVQEFKLKLPATWKNVDFTGANIRRKDQDGETWTLSLQDKVWGGYTLVITYDEQFDPQKATLSLGGVHALGVERETGTLAVASATSLQLREKNVSGPLRRMDESDLAPTDRALITRSPLLVYRQTAGEDYRLEVEVSRFAEAPVLSAVADRTQLTTVLTEAGQMLTQASYLVKNNDKAYQKFTLPAGAEFWSCYVGGQAVKAERQGADLLVPLPRGANRDLAFPVELVYRQSAGDLKSHRREGISLAAPQTDIQTTYAEWELYVPQTHDLMNFGGNLVVARGTAYSLRDAGREMLATYRDWLTDGTVVMAGGLTLCALALALLVLRRGGRGLAEGLVGLMILAVLAGMLLPALSKARAKATRINAVNHLKEIGTAARLAAANNHGRFPATLDEMIGQIGAERVFRDPETGERFVYLGGGWNEDNFPANGVLAYSPVERAGRREVLLGDGSVTSFDAAQFGEALQTVTKDRSASLEIAESPQRRVMPAAQKPVEAPPPAAVALEQQVADAEVLGKQMEDKERGEGLAEQDRKAGAAEGRSVRPQMDVRQMVRYGLIKLPPAGGVITNALTPPPANSAMPGVSGVTPTVGGGMVGGMGGANVAAPAELEKVSGIQPIRIEVPRTGQRFVFTKVLNVRDDKLVLSATAVNVKARDRLRSTLQVTAFLLGLLLFGWQRRRPAPNSLIATIGLALALGSVAALLMVARSLGIALALASPVLVIVLLVALVFRAWKHRKTVTPMKPPGARAAAATAALAVFLVVSAFAQAGDAPGADPEPDAAISILSANYTGVVHGRVAHVDAEVRTVSSAPNQTVALFGDDIAVETFSALPPDVKLIRDGKTLAVRLAKKGETTIKLGFLVKLAGDAASVNRQLVFGIPPALSSQVTLTVDEPEANVDFPTAVAFHSTTAGGETRVEALIGAGDRVDVRWSPRVKSAAEIAATVFCQNDAVASFHGDIMDLRSVLDYTIAQGELRAARLQLPPGQRLLRVDGGNVRTWQVKTNDAGAQLTVELAKGATGTCRLMLETEQTVAGGEAFLLRTPHTVGVKRETGAVAFAASNELGVTADDVAGAQRVDVTEFKTAPAGVTVVEVYQFLKPDYVLRVHVAPLRPEIEASVRNRVRIGAEQITVNADVDYVIKRVGVFSLRLALPEGFRVEAVNGDFAQWSEKNENGRSVLEITLKQRTLGGYSLSVALARTTSGLARTLAVAGVHPLDVQKLTGFVLVAADVGVQVKTQSLAGLTEVPAATVPGGGSGLAYKFIAGDPVPAAQPWQLTVASESIEPWVRAEVMNWWTVGENLVSGRALVRYDIQNAPVKEFRLRVPAQFKNVEITGANLRRRDQATNEWRVELQNKVIGTYTLSVTWEEPATITEKETTLAVEGVSALGVERETGALAVVARPPLQVTPQAASAELTRVDPLELPDWTGRADPATVAAYRYLRPGYSLALTALRHKPADVLQTLVDEARLSTVIAGDGQMMTELALTVRNNGRQFLEIALPPGAEVWSAFVAGEPVRPSLRAAQRVSLPLERGDANAAAFPVTLTYVSAGKFPERSGKIRLVSPSLDVPIKSAQWNLFLPDDYGYTAFAGTMTRSETEVAPVTERFTAESYVAEESRKSVTRQRELVSSVSQARSQLAAGENRDAFRNYDKARKGGATDEQVQELGLELNRAQSGTLIIGQQQAIASNSARFGEAGQAPAAASYDANVAAQQWERLAQAQEIAVAKARPLRVNLPRTGLRYAFTQLLQTEPGRPMRIEFEAASRRVTNWGLRAILAVGGFLGLWLVTAWWLPRRRMA